MGQSNLAIENNPQCAMSGHRIADRDCLSINALFVWATEP
jgi:hypothetical protein